MKEMAEEKTTSSKTKVIPVSNKEEDSLKSLKTSFAAKIKSHERLKKVFKKLSKGTASCEHISLKLFKKLIKGIDETVGSSVAEKLFNVCLNKQVPDSQKELHIDTLSNWLQLKRGPTLNQIKNWGD